MLHQICQWAPSRVPPLLPQHHIRSCPLSPGISQQEAKSYGARPLRESSTVSVGFCTYFASGSQDILFIITENLCLLATRCNGRASACSVAWLGLVCFVMHAKIPPLLFCCSSMYNFNYDRSNARCVCLFNFQPSLLHKPVEYTLLLEKLGRTIKLDHLTLVEHHHTIAVQDGVEAMGDGNDGAVSE